MGMRRRQKLEERWRPWEAGGCLLWGPASSSAPLSPTMVGCGRPSSLLAIASFLLPLINISHASLMTRIGLRLGGKHSSVSHQVLKKPKRENYVPKKLFQGGNAPQQSSLGGQDPEGGGAGGVGQEGWLSDSLILSMISMILLLLEVVFCGFFC